MLVPPLAHLDAIDRAELNRCLVAWGHRMGAYGFAARNDIGRFTLWNKFAFQAKDVAALRRAVDPVGPDNDLWIEKAIAGNDLCIVAWGPLTKLPRSLRGRWREVVAIADRLGKPLLCFGTAADGQPLHPCMLGYANALRPWSPPA